MRVKCRWNGGCPRTKSIIACGAIFAPASPDLALPIGGVFLFYKDAINWITNIERAGTDFGLERERELLDLLGSPDEGLKIVHIAGTNGKGSVTAYMTAVLVSACIKVGTFNSPSVFEYNERFLLNGSPLTGGLVAKYFTIVRDTIEKEQARRRELNLAPFTPTAFEIETAVALLCFKEEGCEAVILETGLGGRWDATNAVKDKVVSIITPIDFDHCNYLGNTLAEIAGEKADIILKNAITCPQSEEVLDVIKARVKAQKGILTVTGEPMLIAEDIEGQAFEYKGENYFIGLLGDHQLVNASLAIEGILALIDNGFNITMDHIKYGLASAEWKARFEIIGEHNNRFNLIFPRGKLLVLDGGHNPQGAEVLANSLKKYFGGMRIHIVMGVLKDKDYKKMVSILGPLARKISTVTPSSPRALSAEDLAEEITAQGFKAEPYALVPLAVQQALGDYYGEIVVLTGSLTLFKDLGVKYL